MGTFARWFLSVSSSVSVLVAFSLATTGAAWAQAAPPDPPYDTPAVIVRIQWEDEDELFVQYEVTQAAEPLDQPFAGGSPNTGRPNSAFWYGGCGPDDVTAYAEIQPLFLNESAATEDPSVNWNWASTPGQYTIVAQNIAYCTFATADSSDVDRDRYEEQQIHHPQDSEFKVTATVEYYDPGQTAPSRTETLEAMVPVHEQNFAGDDNIPYRRTVGTIELAELAAASPPPGGADDAFERGLDPPAPSDEGTDFSLLGGLLLAVGLVFGLGILVMLLHDWMVGRKTWTPHYKLRRGAGARAVDGSGGPHLRRVEEGPITENQGGTYVATADLPVKWLGDIPHTNDCLVELSDGNEVIVRKTELGPLEQPATEPQPPPSNAPTHVLVLTGRETQQGWIDLGHMSRNQVTAYEPGRKIRVVQIVGNHAQVVVEGESTTLTVPLENLRPLSGSASSR